MWNNCNSCNSPYRISQYYAYPDNCIALPIQSDNLVYSGPNLPCTGITTCNTITVALQKIDAKICELIEMIDECCNVTTSTTTSSSSSTTTTSSSSTTSTTTLSPTTTTTTTVAEDCDFVGEAVLQ